MPNDCAASDSHFTGRHAFRVRSAVPSDASGIHRIVSESMKIYRTASGIKREQLDASSETAADVAAAMLSIPVFVAVGSDGRIVGSVRLPGKKISEFGVPGLSEMLGLPPGETVGYFSRFAVHEDMQGLGIGRLLYLRAEETARKSGYRYILLHTALTNTTMVSFYERRGFRLLCQDLSRGYPRGLFGKKLSGR